MGPTVANTRTKSWLQTFFELVEMEKQQEKNCYEPLSILNAMSARTWFRPSKDVFFRKLKDGGLKLQWSEGRLWYGQLSMRIQSPKKIHLFKKGVELRFTNSATEDQKINAMHKGILNAPSSFYSRLMPQQWLKQTYWPKCCVTLHWAPSYGWPHLNTCNSTMQVNHHCIL